MRLGRISYVNMAPVFYRLDAEVVLVDSVTAEEEARGAVVAAGRRDGRVNRAAPVHEVVESGAAAAGPEDKAEPRTEASALGCA